MDKVQTMVEEKKECCICLKEYDKINVDTKTKMCYDCLADHHEAEQNGY
tara:strand:- start:37260 stop:37406 length:147 start_codon:yes stop_codon:yes gene_type:complete